jgi:chromosome segregation ATPase
VRRFLKNPGEVLERVRKQIGGAEELGGELEAQREDLAKRLASRQAEKDHYIRTYAQGHISEEELDVYLAALKNQTDNLRLLVGSVEADLSQERERQELSATTHAWLLTLRERIAEVEEDTEEAYLARRQLVRLLVEGVTLGERREDGKSTQIRITYRFGPPSAQADLGEGDVFVGGVQNARRLYNARL